MPLNALREPAVRTSLRALLGIIVALVTACGDGGGADADATSFVVTPSSLAFTARQGDPAPPSQALHVHLNDTRLEYGSGWAGGTWPTWITETTFAMIPSHVSDWNHVFVVAAPTLPPGTYTGTLELRTSEPSSQWPPPLVEKKTVRVTYTITAP